MKTRSLLLSLLFIAVFSTTRQNVWVPRGAQAELSAAEPYRIGWISSLTGAAAKYGAYEAAQIALDEINSLGGVLGHPLKLIVEDGRCDGAATAAAAARLIHVEKVKFILGGHCSPESSALAPIIDRENVIALAAISNSPKLTGISRNFFRVSSPSTVQSDMLADHLSNALKLKRLALVFEETAYVTPIAERLALKFQDLGGETVYNESFAPGTTDMRSMLIKVRGARPDVIFFGAQSQDTGYLLVRQARELRLNTAIAATETVGNAVVVKSDDRELFNGIIFAEPTFDPESERTREFIKRYTARFKVDTLPYGVWTAETYDSVILLAEQINRCGDDVEKVRGCLENVRRFSGASGEIGIDENHDGIRSFALKTVRNGRLDRL